MVLGFGAYGDVGRTAQDVVAVCDTAHELVEPRAAVARGDHNGTTPRFADGVEELFYEHVQQVICCLGRTVVDAFAQCSGTGGEFLDGKVFHGFKRLG